jgi:hypothetical protein
MLRSRTIDLVGAAKRVRASEGVDYRLDDFYIERRNRRIRHKREGSTRQLLGVSLKVRLKLPLVRQPHDER